MTHVVMTQSKSRFQLLGQGFVSQTKQEIVSVLAPISDYLNTSPKSITLDFVNLRLVNSLALSELFRVFKTAYLKQIPMTLLLDSYYLPHRRLASAKAHYSTITVHDIKGVVQYNDFFHQDNIIDIMSKSNPNSRLLYLTQDPETLEQLDSLQKFLDDDSTLLIHGETGTGKGFLCNRLLELSKRRGKKMTTTFVTKGNLDLINTTIDGIVKGTFTSAEESKKGIFEDCNHGIVVIDEFGEIDLEVQARLLRLLDTKTIEPLTELPRQLDIKIICATNKDLQSEVSSGRFRRDLYERIKTISIYLKALRDRPQDIALYTHLYIDYYQEKHKKKN